MKRRFLSMLLSGCTALSLLVLPAAAAGAVPAREEAAQVVRALGIMAGDEQGNLNLSSSVTRAEFITMAVKAMPGGRRNWPGGHIPLSRRAPEPLGFRLCGSGGEGRAGFRLQ